MTVRGALQSKTGAFLLLVSLDDRRRSFSITCSVIETGAFASPGCLLHVAAWYGSMDWGSAAPSLSPVPLQWKESMYF
jgi:hypothetical protein